jgi:hypothetical protein
MKVSMKREPLMTQAYFDESVQYLQSTIAKRRSDLNQAHQFKKPHILARANFRDSCELLIARYSRGDEVSAIAADFEQALENWECLHAYGNNGSTDFEYLDDYVRSLWMAGLAWLFNVDASHWTRLLTCAGNEGVDRLFERIVSTKVAGRKPATSLAHHDVYESLDAAWYSSGDDQLTKIRTFLKGWYKKLDGIGWHDSHKGPEGGGFVGYWAIEAAAAVVILKVDDTSLRGLPYYPKDLAAHALRHG